MKNLSPHEEGALDAFDEIVEGKQNRIPGKASGKQTKGVPAVVPPGRKDTLTALRPLVEQRYQAYVAAVIAGLDTLTAYVGLDEHQTEALLHCYESSTDALSELKRTIRDRQPDGALDHCQYCCVGAPRTWDHYFPKAVFPEFSVYPPNLVPCCFDCNTIRGDQWRVDEGRVVVHFYYDTIPHDEALLKAEIKVTSGLPTITFKTVGDAAQNQSLGRLFARHCKTLDLFERWKASVRSLIQSLRNEIQDWSPRVTAIDEVAIGEIFQKKAERKRNDLGASHWETAVVRAASESPEFIRYCMGKKVEEVAVLPMQHAGAMQ